jgi:hypothetical protein
MHTSLGFWRSGNRPLRIVKKPRRRLSYATPSRLVSRAGVLQSARIGSSSSVWAHSGGSVMAGQEVVHEELTAHVDADHRRRDDLGDDGPVLGGPLSREPQAVVKEFPLVLSRDEHPEQEGRHEHLWNFLQFCRKTF